MIICLNYCHKTLKVHLLFSAILHRQIDLIRTYGSEADLPEYNKKRRPAKEEYISIIMRLLTIKCEDDLDAVSRMLEAESSASPKKGFGSKGVGFGASSNTKNSLK